MSKIGRKPILIPKEVSVSVTDNVLTVKGPKGQLNINIHPAVKVQVKEEQAVVSVDNPGEKKERALWGTFRSLIEGAVTGVVEGYEKKLEIVGVGYKASVSGTKLILSVGFSHPIEMEIPKGLEVKVDKNIIVIAGPDKQLVGEFAANIRQKRKPEPYKGKGIRYADEVVRRKAGKVAKALGEQ